MTLIARLGSFGKTLAMSMVEKFFSVRYAGREPERFYYGFVLGLMVELSDRYIFTANRESGFGRYDVMLEPRRPGDDRIILEFKVQDPERKRQSLRNLGVFKASDFYWTVSFFCSIFFRAKNPLGWIFKSALLAKLLFTPFFLHIFQFSR